MRRIAIIGPGGAGKSTLATLISRRTGLPVAHLDPLFWRAGWTPAPREAALRELDAVSSREEWILEGNFLPDGGGTDARFERADTVVFLDLPRTTCLARVLKRLVRDRGRSRPDLPPGCAEGLDLAFMRWVWSYPTTTRPRVLELLARIGPNVEVHRLRSRAEVQRFLDNL